MRFKVKRRAGIITEFTIRAEDDEEGVVLKDAVLASAKKPPLSPEGIINEIERIWQEREPEDEKASGASPAAAGRRRQTKKKKT